LVHSFAILRYWIQEVLSLLYHIKFDNFFNLTDSSIIPSYSYNALNGTPIQVKYSVTTSVELELLPKTVSNVTFHILEDNVLLYNLILGRDFLIDNNISFTYTPLREDLKNRIQLFFEIATIDIIESTSNETTNILSDITIDFDSNVKQQLLSFLKSRKYRYSS